MSAEPLQCLGAIAACDGPEALVAAATKLRAAGYVKFDAHSPFPVRGLDEAVGMKPSALPWIVLAGGLFGASFGYWLQWIWCAVAYPLITDGKPYNSAEAFVPITFEFTILIAAFSAVGGMLALNGLPRLHHPAFASDAFARVASDGFFLTVEAADPKFNRVATLDLLREIGGFDVALLEEEFDPGKTPPIGLKGIFLRREKA